MGHLAVGRVILREGVESEKAKGESWGVTRPDPRVGLCSVCANVRLVRGERSTFYLCELAFRDARFRKYPALPVVRCEGFVPAAEGELAGGEG